MTTPSFQSHTSTLGHLFRLCVGCNSAGRVLASSIQQALGPFSAPRQRGVLVHAVMPASRAGRRMRSSRLGQVRWLVDTVPADKSEDMSLTQEATWWKEGTNSHWLSSNLHLNVVVHAHAHK